MFGAFFYVRLAVHVLSAKKNSRMEESMKERKIDTRKLVMYGFMGALAYVLMLIHLPFKYLGFLELEFSDIPAIVVSFAYGPVGGVVVEVIKNAIKALTASTTGGVGELANLFVSIAYVVPSALIFRKWKGKEMGRNVIAGLAGTGCMMAMGIVINYFVTVPLYAKLFGGMEAVIGACAATVPAINSVATVVVLGITPFNLVKGIIISIVGILVYQSTKQIFKTEKTL